MARDDTLQVYSADANVRKYRRATAGEGINYLLPTSYGPIFRSAATAALADTGSSQLRALEFGCGAGMAIHHLVEDMTSHGTEVDLGIGADLVPEMIEAANRDRDEFASASAKERLRYVVAPNETLVEDIASALDQEPAAIEGTFQLAIGVNTFRYAVRHGTTATVVDQLERLLAPGGRVVMIDMNDRFPYGVKPKRSTNGWPPLRFDQPRLPTLDEYAQPFADGGFEVLERRHFCWIPHSASGARFRITKVLSPALDRVVPDHAMRSLVIARKRA
jgi:SAM-dependent methyltransferase